MVRKKSHTSYGTHCSGGSSPPPVTILNVMPEINKRNIYFKDASLWAQLKKIAAEEDRSINYIVERAVKVEVGILIPSDIKKLKPVKVKVK